jgi:hypothetical protein
MKTKTVDGSLRLRNSFSVLQRRPDYTEGTIVTPHGIVSVYTEVADYDMEINSGTILEFVYRRRYYRRDINRAYSERGLSTVANRFAKEIVNKAFGIKLNKETK